MSKPPTIIEQRLAALESAVADLQQQLKSKKGRWIDRFIGSMANDPGFSEVVRLGREWRQSQRLPEEEKP